MPDLSAKSLDKKSLYSNKNLLKFIVPSLIGVFLFMIPIFKEDGITIPVAILSGNLQKQLGHAIPFILLVIICITFLGTIFTKIFKPSFILKNSFLNSLFNVTPIWVVIRILATIFVICTFFNIGPSAIFSENTGSLILFDLLPILFSIFLFAGLFLPLLLNFGLLEFVGSLMVKLMRPIFNLPGRSAIDCIASWLGDGSIGVLLTSKQYEEGFYTEREAAVIGTTFSLVSITFTLVIIDTVGLSHMFIPFYLTVTFASIVAAIIIPKIPPLSKKRDLLIDGTVPDRSEEIPSGYNGFTHGYAKALEKAQSQNMIQCIFIDGFKNVLDMWFAVIPIVMAVGTLALIVAEFTPIFRILGLPFLPILWLLQVPEAVAASQTLVAGFADMLLPSIMGATIQSDMTRFTIACVSVTQLIYLSEVGALLLGSKIPVKFKELFIIFIERTIVTLPIIAVIAHLIF